MNIKYRERSESQAGDSDVLVVSKADGSAVYVAPDGDVNWISRSFTDQLITFQKERDDLEVQCGKLVILKNDLEDRIRIWEGKVVALTEAASMRPAPVMAEVKESGPAVDPIEFIGLLTSSVERIVTAIRGPLTPGPGAK